MSALISFETSSKRSTTILKMIVKLGADDEVHDVALRVLTGEEQRLAALIV